MISENPSRGNDEKNPFKDFVNEFQRIKREPLSKDQIEKINTILKKFKVTRAVGREIDLFRKNGQTVAESSQKISNPQKIKMAVEEF